MRGNSITFGVDPEILGNGASGGRSAMGAVKEVFSRGDSLRISGSLSATKVSTCGPGSDISD
jgi:hypothetical protein